MKSLEILLFELSGEYGHFRKFNTTSSPLTYSIPTRVALVGILGAILGVEREVSTGVYPNGVTPVNELFDREKTYFAVQILNPVKKVNIGFNLLDTGKSASTFFNIQNRTQIEFELLKNPKYRIFFGHDDKKVFGEIANRIKAVDHHFTPYLGLSQFTAKVDWLGTEKLVWQNAVKDDIEINSILNLSLYSGENNITLGRNAFYSSDTMPMAMRRDRVVTEYAEVLIERTGQPISIKTDGYWLSSKGKILFL